MSASGHYDLDSLPKEILDMPIINSMLRIEVINTGRRTGFSHLSEQMISSRGKVKNHWRFNVLVEDSVNEKQYSVSFGPNPLKDGKRSDGAQYNPGAGSDKGRQAFMAEHHDAHGSDAADLKPFIAEDTNDYGQAKPGPYSSDYSSSAFGSPLLLPALSDPHMSPTGSVKSLPFAFIDEQARSTAGGSDLFINSPPSVCSTGSVSINLSGEGTVWPGIFAIKVSDRLAPSTNAFVVFEMSLLPSSLTLNQIVNILVEADMFPFNFRKLPNSAFCGCRDFIFNALALFIREGYTDGFVHKENKHLFELISYRYSYAASDTEGTSALESSIGVRYTPSPVDRGIWSKAFVAYQDDRVTFG